MRSFFLKDGPIDLTRVEDTLRDWLESLGRPLRRVLLIPPDGTRAHSWAGPITRLLYRLLQPAEVKVLPALGTHAPMTAEEKARVFGEEIPAAAYIDHRWRTDVNRVGIVPGSFVEEVSEGLVDYPIAVDINRELEAVRWLAPAKSGSIPIPIALTRRHPCYFLKIDGAKVLDLR